MADNLQFGIYSECLEDVKKKLVELEPIISDSAPKL